MTSNTCVYIYVYYEKQSLTFLQIYLNGFMLPVFPIPKKYFVTVSPTWICHMQLKIINIKLFMNSYKYLGCQNKAKT